jgi:hypothetical protein
LGLNIGIILFGMIFVLAIILVIVAAHWKLFTKAGKPGWASIVPIYNIYVLLQIIGRPWWWLLLLFVPFINIIVAVMICLDLAKAFGKGTAFGVFGLVIFPYIGYLILAFGSSTYIDLTSPIAPAPMPVAPTPTPPATTV